MRAARIALVHVDAQEAARWSHGGRLGPGESGILLHEAVGHGLEGDFNRKKTSNYTDQIGKSVGRRNCVPWSTTRPSATREDRSTSTTKCNPGQRQLAHRERQSVASYLSRPHLGSSLHSEQREMVRAVKVRCRPLDRAR